MRALTELKTAVGKRVPFLRWSVIRMVLGRKSLLKNWQVGDGREEALARYVIANARHGSVDDVIRVIDEFAYSRSILMNVGDEKGEILDSAIQRVGPKRILELGTYCGYSALRMHRAAPEDARVYSVEFSAENAAIARRIWDHAGVGDRIAVIVGTLGDGGVTMARLEADYGFAPGTLDFVFIDHEKSVYLADLERILAAGWLRPGAVAVADNVKVPGAPEYRAYMQAADGRLWRTIEHETHLEYQSLIKDLVLESEYLGPA